MSYDLHGSYDGVTGQNSPLYTNSVDRMPGLSQDSAIKEWIDAGASPQKLLMGVGFYGQSFTLASFSNTKVGAPASGPGKAGPYSQQAGMLTYLEVIFIENKCFDFFLISRSFFQICENLGDGTWTTVYDEQQKTPFSYSGDQWVGYDNVKSVRTKAQYVRDMKLGGIMIWSIDSDDHNNVCGGGKFPLLNAINDVIKTQRSNETELENPNMSSSPTKRVESTVPATVPATIPTKVPVVILPSPAIATVDTICEQDGYLRDATSCNTYYQCVSNG